MNIKLEIKKENLLSLSERETVLSDFEILD